MSCTGFVLFDLTISQLPESFSSAGAGPEAVLLGGDGWELGEYDGFNQLTRTIKDGLDVGYAYKPDGLRFSKTVDGATITHVWDGDNMVAELSGSNVIATYLRGINLIYAQGAGIKTFYSFNAHGDVVQLSDASGNVIKNYDYDAFGNEYDLDENDGNPWRYCGEYWDGETGTVYLRARYYSPKIGRFTQEDPIGDGLNWYTYCSNNPIAFIDPLGLLEVSAREYAEFRGAIVKWRGNYISKGITCANATIYIDGKPNYITGVLKNGKLMIDDSILNSRFGWNAIYTSQEDVAKAWAKAQYGFTNYLLLEMSSLIYELVHNGKSLGFSYTPAIMGGPHNADGIWDGKKNITSNGTMVGFVHSHVYSKGFSALDMELSADLGITVFAATPGASGSVNVSRYNSANASDSPVIATGIKYRALTSLERKEYAERYRKVWERHAATCKEHNCANRSWPNG